FFLLDILSLTASRQQRHGNPQQAADAALTQLCASRRQSPSFSEGLVWELRMELAMAWFYGLGRAFYV
uniref:hypothetical protein n=1 Tax=Faecalicatena contorta TaxID=39482 RepID=UPI00359C3772